MSSLTFNDEYVQKLAAGDREVEKHFTTHFGVLLRIKLRTKLRSPQLIEDIRQETFLRVLQTLRKRDGLHNPERLGSFVNSVCNNVMLESFRSATRHRQMPEDTPEIVDESADPTQGLMIEERARIVAGLLAELPAKDRELLRQVFFEERDKEDICREMKVSQEYLRVLIHRAKAKFKSALERSSGHLSS